MFHFQIPILSMLLKMRSWVFFFYVFSWTFKSTFWFKKNVILLYAIFKFAMFLKKELILGIKKYFWPHITVFKLYNCYYQYRILGLEMAQWSAPHASISTWVGFQNLWKRSQMNCTVQYPWLSTQEPGRSWWIPGQPGLPTETLSRKNNTTTKKWRISVNWRPDLILYNS